LPWQVAPFTGAVPAAVKPYWYTSINDGTAPPTVTKPAAADVSPAGRLRKL
jgi:hypothetical protein